MSSNDKYAVCHIDGMTCASCELLLEKKLRAVGGIKEVDVDYKTGLARITADGDNPPDAERIESIIKKAGYSLAVNGDASAVSSFSADKQKWLQIGAALLILFAVYKLLQVFDLVSLAPSTSGALSVGGILLIGIVAGTSSCLAVTGGLLLALAARHNEVHQAETPWQRFRPLMHFNIGRIISYTVFGGAVGVLGQSITLGTRMTGFMNIIVAFVMLYLALTILEILPKGSFPIRPPKKISRWIAGLSESDNPAAPIALGALTFFLPCGFTQSLQIAALASGSFSAGALIMGMFALGTLPSLLGISVISSTASGKFSQLFLHFSGTVVLVLALLNMSSGLTLTGYDIARVFSRADAPAAVVPTGADGVQEVSMRVTSFGYEPSNLTVKAGVPVRWKVDGTQAGGCTSVMTIPSLNITQVLQRGENIIEFTPTNKGTLAFTCSMGMVSGSFSVI